MRVLKIEAEGITTSFRYPHFMQQIHPSFQMPPPATIYGHICSTMGEWVDPAGLQFAYRFTYLEAGKDIEHIIVLSPGRGKLPNTKHPKVLEGKVNPFERDLLFQPRLTLYLNRPEWAANFRRPRYAVVLGRSQDLFTYTQVRVIELEQADQSYFEHTLLPHHLAAQVMRGVSVLMPRYLDYARRRRPIFSRYLAVRERVMMGDDSQDVFTYSHSSPGPYWIDPASPVIQGRRLGLWFHTFIGDDGDALDMA